ncbi:MAG TPA: tyrosine--tRNA ligase [Gemmatimonadaceae bacterium]|jgi:tyrosyl-tRNA synthetase|nr:tyrosine--tRNA ligase [Gemmatimonadaceae bacterium]
MRSHALLDELRWRGLLHQHTEGVGEALHGGPLTGYVGFDPTARSLHVGNLLPVMDLVHLQRHGHTPVALVGGGTGLIGDPGGRTSERPLASPETIAENAGHIHLQLERFLDFTGRNAARMINNAEWLVELKAIEFMRDVGKHFTVNYMMQKDSVQSRMEAGISYTEFSYMLLQAYDFLELRRRHGVRLQMGGSDQWGNITAGIELIRRTLGSDGDAHAITSPLVTNASGAKFGKSEAGAVWLDASLTSPYKFYQFFVNVDDRDAGRYLRYLSLLPQAEIEQLEQALADKPETREAQHALARAVTGMVHGAPSLGAAVEVSGLLFGGADPRSLSDDALLALKLEIPVFTIEPDADRAELTTYDVLEAICVGADALFKSKGEARRMVQQGGIYINGQRMEPERRALAREELLGGRFLLVRKGARTYALADVGQLP